MRKKDNQEHRVQLAAARHGLKLVRNRSRAATGRSLYCLRAIWNAACVVGSRPEGGLGLVYAQTGRAEIASWLTLSEIAQVLANWREPAPRAWGEPPSAGSGLPYASYRNFRRRGLQRGRALIQRHRLAPGATRASRCGDLHRR
jgi:hypothetical protein